ncbi:MAG: hypothetical protein ACLU4P_00085 [Ruminococcus sp.]
MFTTRISNRSTQSPVLAVLSTIEGESCIREMVLESRYKAADRIAEEWESQDPHDTGNEAAICGYVETPHGA